MLLQTPYLQRRRAFACLLASGGVVEPSHSTAATRSHYQMKDKNDEIEGIVDKIFDDFEAKRNLVGLYSLLLQIDKRINPHLYAKEAARKRD